ncbi:protein FAM26F-like [Silurus meridionalis]|nr:protein FAM26F-like [Silurus meridionalis]
MVNAKFIAEFFRKPLGSVGIFSLILAAFENILDQEFVCPCDRTYNIVVCVLYGAVPSICCFVFTFCFMDGYSEMEDERMRDLHTCDKLLYSILTTIIWLFLFFVDGRYLACAVSVWGGVYAKNETLGIVKWCKPTGNETVVFTSQQDTLKWISRSQGKQKKKMITVKETCTCPRICYTIIAVLIWLMLLLMDGRYVACGTSNWDGVYTKTDNLALTQWCRPNNESSVSEKELRIVTAVFWSQVVGSSLIVVIAISLFCFFFAFNNNENQAVDSVEMEASENSKIKLHASVSKKKLVFEIEEDSSTNSIFACVIWLCIFLLDGRYLACACSDWEGVYAKNESLMILKWCKPTGNKTSVLESQQKTLKWMSRSQRHNRDNNQRHNKYNNQSHSRNTNQRRKRNTKQRHSRNTNQRHNRNTNQRHNMDNNKGHNRDNNQGHNRDNNQGHNRNTNQRHNRNTNQRQNMDNNKGHNRDNNQGHNRDNN